MSTTTNSADAANPGVWLVEQHAQFNTHALGAREEDLRLGAPHDRHRAQLSGAVAHERRRWRVGFFARHVDARLQQRSFLVAIYQRDHKF